MVAALALFLVFEVVGLLAAPLTALVLGRLPGAGLGLSKIFGLLLVTWLMWMAASLRIAPQGTADGSQWEQPLAVGTTARTTVIEVPLGDASRLRIRNASTRSVRLEVALVGGTVYDCP